MFSGTQKFEIFDEKFMRIKIQIQSIEKNKKCWTNMKGILEGNYRVTFDGIHFFVWYECECFYVVSNSLRFKFSSGNLRFV